MKEFFPQHIVGFPSSWIQLILDCLSNVYVGRGKRAKAGQIFIGIAA